MNDFEEYMKFFKGLSLKEKQKIVLDELKVLSYYSNKMCTQLGVSNEMLLNKEQLDTNNKTYTEDDFAEALIVYIGSIKDSLSAFSDELTLIDDKLNKEVQ